MTETMDSSNAGKKPEARVIPASPEADFRQDELTKKIIGCILKVHHAIGPGYRESFYLRALLIELAESGLKAHAQKGFTVRYRGREIGRHRLDVLVEGRIVVELKRVPYLNRDHYAQLRSYLKATGLSVGLLVNHAKELADFRRVTI